MTLAKIYVDILFQMEILLKEKAELEQRLRTINREIHTLGLHTNPEVRAKIMHILAIDDNDFSKKSTVGDVYDPSLDAGITRIERICPRKASSTEAVTIRFVYDCVAGGPAILSDGCILCCPLCNYKKIQTSEFPSSTEHIFDIGFSVSCGIELNIHIDFDGNYNSDSEGDMYPHGTVIDFGWDDNTFTNGPVVVHKKLGPVHKLQYLIYQRWYGLWKMDLLNGGYS